MMTTNEAENFSPDDPRLTAYALGELEDGERVMVEAALRGNAELRASVEAIRATGAELESALAAEAMPVTPELKKEATKTGALRRAAIIAGQDYGKLDGGPLRAKLIRFPQFYYVVSGLAAACFVLFVALRDPGEKSAATASVAERKVYTTLTFPPLEPALPVAPEAKVAEVGSLMEAPLMVMVPPRAVPSGFNQSMVQQNRQAEDRFSRRESVIGPDLSLLAQAGVWDPTKSFVYKSATRRSLDTAGIFYSDTVISAEQFQTGRMASAGRGLAFSSETGRAPGHFGVSFGANAGALPYGSSRGGDLLTGNRTYWHAGDDKFVVEARARNVSAIAAAAQSRDTPRTEAYAYRKDNDFLSVAEHPLSTFAADVDTASYANVRRMLRAGQKPPADAVRVEELVNYFPYRYAPPGAGGERRSEGTPQTSEMGAPAFAAALEVAEAPWAAGHRLVRIGLKAREVAAGERGAANLVFLVDVSGSMDSPERLPLVKESLRLLVNRLRPDDRVAIVTYAGASGLALASTPVAQAREIMTALEAMTPGGATNGGMGIQLAYDIAKANFVTGGVNRVILCTDGDFNVGVTGEGELVRLVQEKAKSGVFLTVLGFGMGNLKDAMLEAIADKGNGSYGYIDSRREAEKLLGAQVNGTLTTVAKDVKLQVEFNPARVASYRLLGYENRLLANPDFNNDKVDAGEVGAGHTMTALYEIVPAGTVALPLGAGLAELKYSRKPVTVTVPLASTGGTLNAERLTLNAERPEENAELLTVKVRYKEPAGDVSRKLEFALTDAGERFADASGDFKFASAVAAFGMVLRDSPHKGTATLAEVATWAEAGAADDPGGWRGEFVELARAADGAR